jgi:hypothetical protein
MQPSHSMLVRAETLSDGVTIDGICFDRGSVVVVDVRVAERLAGHGHVRLLPRPMLRAEQAHMLIGYRVCAKGEVAAAPSLAIANAHHEAGVATFLNRPEVGDSWTLPDRPGWLRVRMVARTGGPGLGAGQYPGEVVGVPRMRAESMIDSGVAVALGWRPAAGGRIRVRAIGPRPLVASQLRKPGEVVEVDFAAADDAIRRGEAEFVGRGPIAWSRSPAED